MSERQTTAGRKRNPKLFQLEQEQTERTEEKASPFPLFSPVQKCAIVVFSLLIAAQVGCHSSTAHDWDRHPSQIETMAARHAPPDPLVQSQQRGRQIYQHYCQICHGPEAQGNGFNAAMLDPPPRNFAEESFWQQADDDHLIAVISEGGKAQGKSILMPAWGRTLDQQQIDDAIAFLKTVPDLAKQAEEAEAE